MFAVLAVIAAAVLRPIESRADTTATAVAIVAAATAVPDEDPPPVFAKTFTIDKQVDPVRHVSKALVRNTDEGDYVLEFSARRTDLPDTQERWLITYTRDTVYDHIQHLDIDRVRIYSSGVSEANGDAMLTFAAEDAVIEIANPCASPDIRNIKQSSEISRDIATSFKRCQAQSSTICPSPMTGRLLTFRTARTTAPGPPITVTNSTQTFQILIAFKSARVAFSLRDGVSVPAPVSATIGLIPARPLKSVSNSRNGSITKPSRVVRRNMTVASRT